MKLVKCIFRKVLYYFMMKCTIIPLFVILNHVIFLLLRADTCTCERGHFVSLHQPTLN